MDDDNLTPAEQAYIEGVEEAQNALDEFEASVTQREWLLACNKLDKTRAEIRRDGSLRLLALGWIREKRDHGGAGWDRLLEMTDRELLDLHGYPRLDSAAAEPDKPVGDYSANVTPPSPEDRDPDA